MLTLKTPVSQLRGIGPSTATKLARLGIRTAGDLLSHFPIRHEDLRKTTSIANLAIGATTVIKGRLQVMKSRRGYRRRRMTITECLVADATGTARVVWFNQPYIGTSYKSGDEVFLIGRFTNSPYGPQLQSPLIEPVRARQLLAGRILPVYRSTSGITQRQIRSFIETALPLAQRLPDWLPKELRMRERLADLGTAASNIHFPRSPELLEKAKERLKFGELLLFSIAVLRTKKMREDRASVPLAFDRDATVEFVRSLPFKLTDDQRRAAWEILRDIEGRKPMNRLLEGDVGSGKTVVAALAMHNIARSHAQTALLAPTDILARQHFKTLQRLSRKRLRVGLLTRTQREWAEKQPPTKHQLLETLKRGELDVIVGTHALLNENVGFSNLALVIIDEQHRFGVEQRRLLQSKRHDRVPHLLSLTATPIPRTLAIALFGDLELSFLRHLPPGRTPITTQVLSGTDEQRVFAHIRESARRGEKTYVVCPIIEESDELGSAAATAEYERLKSSELSGLHIGLLHGKLPAKEKHKALDDFAHAKTHVLVATPVVEVGVDVPDATTMVILGAERFGLAQLHQLRGRVGRSAKPSTCFLLSESDSPDVLERLKLVEQTTDGFKLAEEDLKRRGPGDVYGLRQSGLPEFRMASLTDLELMRRAQAASRDLLSDDPDLTAFPMLKRKAQAFVTTIHAE